jgi:hypothetical protein
MYEWYYAMEGVLLFTITDIQTFRKDTLEVRNVVYVFCILQIYFLCDLLLSCYTSGKVQHTMQTYKSTPFPGNDYTMYKKRTKRNYTCILITLHTPLRMHLVYGMLFCSYIHVKHITFSERYYSYYTGLM